MGRCRLDVGLYRGEVAGAVAQDLVLENEDLVTERGGRVAEDGVLHLQHAPALLEPLLLGLLLAPALARRDPVLLSADLASRWPRFLRALRAASLLSRSRRR